LIRKKIKYSTIILVVLLTAGLIVAQIYLKRMGSTYDMQMITDWNFPDYNFLNLISLGNQIVVSDLINAKALTYFGKNYKKQEDLSFPLLEQMLISAIKLDPDNKEGILLAGNLLAGEHSQTSIRILKMGMSYHPKYWKFPEMIGFQYFFYLKNNLKAAKYYETASRLPEHPPYVPSLSGKFYVESGRISEAIRVLNNFFQTAKDPRLKKSFKKTILKLQKDLEEKNYKLIGRITKVVDGDSFEVEPDINNLKYRNLKRRERFRAIGINSYEMTASDKKLRLFSRLQRDFAYFYLKNKRMIFEFERNTDYSLKRDKYGRLLGYMYFPDSGQMYQELALKSGFINGFYDFDFKYTDNFKELEAEAGKSKNGLRGFPPIKISVAKLNGNVGRIVKTSFLISEIRTRENYYLLVSKLGGQDIRVVLPKSYLKNFTRSSNNRFVEKLKNRWLTITGFLQIYEGAYQIRLYYPEQLW
jgi:endonuclease YncB( thermonuclease family)